MSFTRASVERWKDCMAMVAECIDAFGTVVQSLNRVGVRLLALVGVIGALVTAILTLH